MLRGSYLTLVWSIIWWMNVLWLTCSTRWPLITLRNMILLYRNSHFEVLDLENLNTRLWNNGIFPQCFHWIQPIQGQKIIVIKRAQTFNLLCKRSGCYHRTSKTYVWNRIFTLSPIHVSAIYQIPWIYWIQWKFCSI